MPNTVKTFDMIFRYVNKNWVWLVLFILSVIYLFAIANKRRKATLVAVGISLCLFINDSVMYFVEEVMEEHQRYYRYLWIIPFIFIIVTSIVDVYRRCKHIITRVIILISSCVLLIFLYQDRGWFDALPEYNINILPEGVKEISDKLDDIKEDKDLFVACPNDLYHLFKMYNGNIYFASEYTVIKENELDYYNFSSKNPDVESIMSSCRKKGMDYIVVKLNGNSKKIYEECGFSPILETDGLGLFSCLGYEGIIQDYNKNGQISYISYVDEKNNQIINSLGFSMAQYFYDRKGNKIEELYYGKDGERCKCIFGYAGIRYEYDNCGRNIGCTYEDELGNPIKRVDQGYASIKYEWDNKNHIIRESYYDLNGQMTNKYNTNYAICTFNYIQDEGVIEEKYFDSTEKPCYQLAGFCGKRKKFKDGLLMSIEYLDFESNVIDRKDGYSQAKWIRNDNTGSSDVWFYNTSGEQVQLEGLNLARDIEYGSDGWSNWMTPSTNTDNVCFDIGYFNLGPKKEGDIYSCYMCIEFLNVSSKKDRSFHFLTQGATDGKWDHDNIWNSSLLFLNEIPEDGKYYYKYTTTINKDMMPVSEFNIGFRCDNWASGSFRVKDVMIVKGEECEEWQPGL